MFENCKDILSVEELSKILGICKSKAYHLINSGEIKSFKLGKVNKIPKVWVIEYIKSKTA